MSILDTEWSKERQNNWDFIFASFLIALMFVILMSVFFHLEREDEKKQIQKIYSVDSLVPGK